MKTEIQAQPAIKIMWYICEYCGKKSKNMAEVHSCEKDCKLKSECMHEFKYTLTRYQDELIIDLSRKCTKCEKEEEKEIDPNKITEDIIKKLWNMK